MDIICPKCGEPWEFDTLHDYADEAETTYADVAKTFRKLGCGKAFANWNVTCHADERSAMRSVLADLLGDDLDGYASLCEDFRL
jgi:hypothetical protein